LNGAGQRHSVSTPGLGWNKKGAGGVLNTLRKDWHLMMKLRLNLYGKVILSSSNKEDAVAWKIKYSFSNRIRI
jgi:nucleoside-specific outer membrane channel protein Tsx